MEDWQDIWINEGFATYAEWLWLEETGGEEAMMGAIRRAYSLFAPDEPQVRLPKAPFLQQLQSFPLGETTLTLVEAERALRALLGSSLGEAQLAAVVQEIPAEGLSAEEVPGLMQEVQVETIVVPNAQLVQALRILGLDEVAAQFPTAYTAPGRPPIGQLFGQSVYQRGGLTFAALNARLGDALFFDVIRTYIQRYGGGAAGTDELIAVAEEVSGEKLSDFFHAWLFGDALPDIPELDLVREEPSTWETGSGE